jgi:electron transport complex protein RnfA
MSWAGSILTYAFVNNVVLVELLGVCPFLGIPRSPRAAARVSLAIAAAMPAAAAASWALRRFVLAPLGLESLQLLALCLALTVLVLLPAAALGGSVQALRLRLLLPQAAVNCAVLGVGLGIAEPGGLASLAAGAAAGAGFLAAALMFSGLKERMDKERTPRAMRGLPLSLVTAGLMAMCFLAFDRLVLLVG